VLLPGRGRGRLPDLDDLLGDPALRAQPELAAEWEPHILSNTYDRGTRPRRRSARPHRMGMTEKQGGTDVRANTTIARA